MNLDMQDEGKNRERDGGEIKIHIFTGQNKKSNLQGAAEQTVQEITELVSS